MVLPLLVRRRNVSFDLVGAGLWAAGLAAAHMALGDLLVATVQLPQARGAIAGSVMGALAAVAASAVVPAAAPQDIEPAPASKAPRGLV